MKIFRCTNGTKAAAGVMAVMMLLVMLLSSFFIAAHADHHDCTGEDCPICACIQQCENNIRGIGSSITVVSAVVLPVFIGLQLTFSGILSFQWNTPVSTKVRMNN